MSMAKTIETKDGRKLKEYVRLGFTEYQARRLTTVSDLEVATIKELLSKGCKVNIAYRIYRP